MIQGKTFKDKYFCSSPFNSLFIDVHGGVSSCCSGTYTWGNHLNRNPKEPKRTIKEIINSEDAQNIRDDIANAKINSYCDGCAKEENIFGLSQRGHFDRVKINPNKFELRTLDLRWSNLCNFSCIYCDEDFSSSWAKKKGMGLNKENVTSQKQIFELIEESADTIEKIMLAGGEPLLQMQNDKLLDIVRKDTNITIITNLGVELEKSNIFKKLKDFDNIIWAVSMENVGEQFEYVRQGGNWDRMKNNLELIKNTNPNHNYNFLSVMNILSLSQLHEFVSFSNEVEIPITWQYINGNGDVLHPEMFSKNVKDYLINKIETIPTFEKYVEFNKQSLTSLSDKIKNSKDFANWEEVQEEDIDLDFRKYINIQDSQYNELSKGFGELWPELDKLIQKPTLI